MKKSLDPADTVLREIEAVGKRSFIPSIGPVKGNILGEIVKKVRPKRILDVGALYGYSAILMAKNSPPKAEIISVDKSPEHVRMAIENIRRANMEGRIRVIEGDGRTEVMRLSGSFDLILLEAEDTHTLEYM